MSEFTKDDLEAIQEALVCLKMLEHDHDFILTDKIQSLIDNYCDHENTYHCDYCGIISCDECKHPCGGNLIDE